MNFNWYVWVFQNSLNDIQERFFSIIMLYNVFATGSKIKEAFVNLCPKNKINVQGSQITFDELSLLAEVKAYFSLFLGFSFLDIIRSVI